jgi:hypothetical protein
MINHTWHIELNAINAYKEGKTLLDNPYPENTEQSDLWNEAWIDYHNAQTEKNNEKDLELLLLD